MCQCQVRKTAHYVFGSSQLVETLRCRPAAVLLPLWVTPTDGYRGDGATDADGVGCTGGVTVIYGLGVTKYRFHGRRLAVLGNPLSRIRKMEASWLE